jgi:hypothetical protein
VAVPAAVRPAYRRAKREGAQVRTLSNLRL